jgi:decaprenyl-phosphate phosphoribosyltransferase
MTDRPGTPDRVATPVSRGDGVEPVLSAPPETAETEAGLEPRTEPEPGSSSEQARLAAGLWHTARPRQWAKNALVLAAPAAAGVLGQPAEAAVSARAVVAFCLVASGTYFVNDALDAASDRLHEVKRHRPIAAGVVAMPLAWAVGVALLAGGLGLAAMTLSLGFTAIVAAYVAMTLAYSVWLKHLAVVDLVVVAGGFVLRAVGGGLAVGVPLSEWFLIVTSFAALFVVAGKRHAELVTLGQSGAAHRATLGSYGAAFTEHVLTLSAGVTLVAYCLWAFEDAAGNAGGVFPALSVAPFLIAMLRYGLLVHQGHGGEPEELLRRDRGLQLAGLIWAVLVALGIYA